MREEAKPECVGQVNPFITDHEAWPEVSGHGNEGDGRPPGLAPRSEGFWAEKYTINPIYPSDHIYILLSTTSSFLYSDLPKKGKWDADEHKMQNRKTTRFVEIRQGNPGFLNP
jgi:hypothetical protein